MSFSKIKLLVKDSALYGISGIISRMITIFLVPIYTRIFYPSDYGLLNLVNSTFFLVGLFVICALDNASARWFYDLKSENEKKEIFSSWFWFQFSNGILFGLLLISGVSIFAKYIFKVSVEDIWLIWLLACLNLFTNILPGIIWNWYRLHQRPIATMIYSLIQSILTISLTVLFVVYLKWHLVGVFAALLISSGLFSLIAIVQLKSWIHPKFFNLRLLKEMLRFSMPMVPASIAYWLINSTNSYFILYFKDKTEVGLFSVGASLAAGVSLVVGAFQQAWGPFAYSIMNEPDAEKTYANVFSAFGLLSSVIILGMFLFVPEILMILTTPNYYGAAWVASILSINIILGGFIYIASIGASIAKNTSFYATGVIIGSIITVILNIILIPLLGKEGSALATVLAQLLIPIYLIYKSNKIYFIDYNYKLVVSICLAAVLVGCIVRFIPFQSLLVGVVSKIIIFVCFSAGAMYCAKGFLGSLIKDRF